MSRIDAICGLLPVTKIVIETASFDIQKIKHPDVEGTDYQQAISSAFGTCVNTFSLETVTFANTVTVVRRTRSSTCTTSKAVKPAGMRPTT